MVMSAPIACSPATWMFTGRAPMAQPPGRETSALSEARDQRPEHQDRGAHGLHQLIRRKALLHRRAIDLDPHALVDGHGGAHAAEQLDRRGDVLQMRHVGDHDRIVGEQRARRGSAAWRSWRPKCAPRPRGARPPGSAACPCQPLVRFFGGQRFDGERVNLTAHPARPEPCRRAGGARGCACRRIRAATMRAAKWVLSSDSTWTCAPGRAGADELCDLFRIHGLDINRLTGGSCRSARGTDFWRVLKETPHAYNRGWPCNPAPAVIPSPSSSPSR